MILNFSIEQIAAEKSDKEIKGNLEAKNNLKIKDVVEQSLEPLSKDKVIKLTFAFNVTYEPKIGSIELKGHVLYGADDRKRKEIVTQWKKEKKLDQQIGESIINYLLQKCNIRALHLAQEINLPPHIPFPRIVKKEGQKEE